MACTVIEGEFGDTVEFTRSGVKGELIVTAEHFELHAKLGLLLGAFKNTIEAEIEKELDGLLSAAGKPYDFVARGDRGVEGGEVLVDGLDAEHAEQAGARRLPFPIPGVMALASRVMKTIAYRI